MKFPDSAYLAWAKAMPPAAINLARSGIDPCPVSLLGLRASDLVATLPVKYGYRPLREAVARRYVAGPVLRIAAPHPGQLRVQAGAPRARPRQHLARAG